LPTAQPWLTQLRRREAADTVLNTPDTGPAWRLYNNPAVKEHWITAHIFLWNDFAECSLIADNNH
jgi:hypothetical protein